MRPTAACLAVAEDAAPDKPLAGNRAFRSRNTVRINNGCHGGYVTDRNGDAACVRFRSDSVVVHSIP